MIRTLGTLGVALLCGGTFAGSAMAADLILDVPSVAEAAPSDWGQFYLEVYGGVTLEGTATISYNGNPTYDSGLEPSAAFGASLGMMTPIEGLALELDIMKAGGGEYSDYPDESHATFSAMINAEYTLPINDMFAIYGAVGVGVIKSIYTGYGIDYDAMGAGYQLAAGVRAQVTEGVSVFGELKYQNSFEGIEIPDSPTTYYAVQYPTVNAVAGLRFNF